METGNGGSESEIIPGGSRKRMKNGAVQEGKLKAREDRKIRK